LQPVPPPSSQLPVIQTIDVVTQKAFMSKQYCRHPIERLLDIKRRVNGGCSVDGGEGDDVATGELRMKAN
jgi:hypothetical protein